MIQPIDALHFGRPDVEDERWRYKQELLDKLYSERELLISEMFTMSLKGKELVSGTEKNVQQKSD